MTLREARKIFKKEIAPYLPNSVVQLCVIRTIVQRLSNITEGSSELLQMIPILDVFSTNFCPFVMIIFPCFCNKFLYCPILS